MFRIARVAAALSAMSLVLAGEALAADGVRLSSVAEMDGYSYQWMPMEDGATLSRPGVRVVIRAGQIFYEVNSATPIADRAPWYDGRDILVSPKLAEHLRLIALKYPYPPSYDGWPNAAPHNATPPPGGPLTLKATAIPGREALAISGSGPANTPITVTLLGEMSTDLPVVTLMTRTIETTDDGTFAIEAGYGQDAHPRTSLAVTAKVADGRSSASPVTLLIGPPSPQVTTPGFDVWPKK